MDCLRSEFGHAMRKHPDWYLVAAFVRCPTVEIHGLDDRAITLAEVQAVSDASTPDERRLAIELTPGETRKLWGVWTPMPDGEHGES